jgi:hypothetical protein
MNVRPTTRRVATVALAAGAALALTTGTALAAPAAGNYAGNQCTPNFYVDNAGAEGCVWVDHFEPGSRILFTLGAVDYARDGKSARNVTYVDQYFPGYGWYRSGTFIVTESSGYGYTRIGSQQVVNKQAGATVVRVTINACTYDAPSATYYSCGSKASSKAW